MDEPDKMTDETQKPTGRQRLLPGPVPSHCLATRGVLFALAAFARLLKVLVLAKIRQDARFLALLLEATERALEGFPILDPNSGHAVIAPFPATGF
jgi:hypothetical protein